jgi:PhoD-like phosphatase/Alpha/beta hydrolase of unknown function (DUF900)
MKIVFTSCMDAERVHAQPIWTHIQNEVQPDVLMLLGDQIYMDWGDLGEPAWARLLRGDEPKHLKAFAQEMHRRYALQWSVDSFRQFIQGFAGRGDPSKLLLTWDDHDFAWNNALGNGGRHERGVSHRVKSISRRLFAQFEQQLRQASGQSYPELPADWAIPFPDSDTQGLFWQGQLNGGTGPECLLLDTRWMREDRATNASILGTAQMNALLSAASTKGAGPLLLAGGAPMAHNYLLSDQAWRSEKAPNEPSYTDYDALLHATKRPVIYLSGDIHRNAWSGRLADTAGNFSPVVQALSSGAAIGGIGPKRFAPSFGLLRWQSPGQISLELFAQNQTGGWQPTPTVPSLRLNAQGSDWAEELKGEAASQVDAIADHQPLAVLCARPRDRDYRGTTTIPFSELEQLDAVFRDSAPASGTYPEPLLLASDPKTSFGMSFAGDIQYGNRRTDEIKQLIEQAFKRALARDAKSVVLFIHGFGKSFSQSVAQAYQVRQQFPDCEPILYSWDAGRSSSAASAIGGVSYATTRAEENAFALSSILGYFANICANDQFKNLVKIIVARSAGSLAMDRALRLGHGALHSQIMSSVSRVVLSAPLIKHSVYKNEGGFGGLKMPVIVTRNKGDQTLHFASRTDGWGDIMGLEETPVLQGLGHVCLDFSTSPGVGRLHDYLLLGVSACQSRVNAELLGTAGGTWDTAALCKYGQLTALGHGIYQVN